MRSAYAELSDRAYRTSTRALNENCESNLTEGAPRRRSPDVATPGRSWSDGPFLSPIPAFNDVKVIVNSERDHGFLRQKGSLSVLY